MVVQKPRVALISQLRSYIRTTPSAFWLLPILSSVMVVWLSVRRYVGYNVAMLDLGNMVQAIASVRRGQPLVFTFVDGNTSRLAMHVELIYFLLAPLYALWPDPRSMLVAQALLFVLGALPVYRMALRRTESVFAARCFTLIYLFYPVAQTSVLFDLHGDTLAMPLLMFALDALDQRAWRRYALFIALALSCKFYVAAPVAVLGLVLCLRPETRRAGLLTAAAGFVYGILAFTIIRPLFTTAETSSAHRGLNYIGFYFGQLSELLGSLDQRLISAVVVFVPVMLVPRHGWRWLVPALPIAAAALLSTGPGGAYDYRYHHYAIVVPFLMMAAIQGISQRKIGDESRSRIRISIGGSGRRRVRGRSWKGDLVLTLVIVLIFNTAFVDTPLNPLFWLKLPGQGLSASVYGKTTRDEIKDRWLAANVPPVAPIAISNFLAPRTLDRQIVYLVRYPDEPTAARLSEHLKSVNHAFPDALFDFVTPLDDGFAGGVAYDVDAIRQLLGAPGWGLTVARDGLLRFDRNPPDTAVLQQQIRRVDDQPSVHASFGDGIELAQGNVEPLGQRRYRATFRWRATRDLRSDEFFVAVSRLEGVANARIVHLPTYALQPTTTWRAGDVWEEQFDVEIPSEVAPGRYTWHVGWYDTRSPFASETDDRSRVGAEIAVMDLDLR